jgi:hypothetical protein
LTGIAAGRDDGAEHAAHGRYLRFSHTGSTKGPWRSATWPMKVFVIS